MILPIFSLKIFSTKHKLCPRAGKDPCLQTLLDSRVSPQPAYSFLLSPLSLEAGFIFHFFDYKDLFRFLRIHLPVRLKVLLLFQSRMLKSCHKLVLGSNIYQVGMKKWLEEGLLQITSLHLLGSVEEVFIVHLSSF